MIEQSQRCVWGGGVGEIVGALADCWKNPALHEIGTHLMIPSKGQMSSDLVFTDSFFSADSADRE